MLLRRSALTVNAFRQRLRQMCVPARRDVAFVSGKLKEEILELHEEDDKRWTATTLSTRFGVPYNNVALILKLGQIRQKREAKLRALSAEKRKEISNLCSKATTSWATLPSISGGGATKRRVLRASLAEEIRERSASVEKQPPTKVNDSNEAVGKPSTAVEIKTEKSPWAEYIEEHYRDVELDTVRRSSFAFIEIGKKKNLQRAIWVREGATGKLRIADDEERKLLTAQIKVRDSTAFTAPTN